MTALWQRLERQFAAVIGSTPLPEVTEHIGVDEIQIGNADIPTPEWVPTVVTPSADNLPGHEHLLGHTRPMNPAHVQAWVDAMLARVDAHYDPLLAYMGEVVARFAADGIRPASLRTRLGDPK